MKTHHGSIGRDRLGVEAFILQCQADLLRHILEILAPPILMGAQPAFEYRLRRDDDVGPGPDILAVGAVLTGLLYAIWGLWTGHFRSNLFPAPAERTWRSAWGVMSKHIRLKRPDPADALSYNVLQRAAYLMVIFVLFPLVIWTGLALSPGFNSAVPAGVNLLGGRQSARTLHFFISAFLLLFLIVHVAMIVLAGFASRMRAMITGTTITGTAIAGTTIARTTISGTATTGPTMTSIATAPQQRVGEERI